MREKNEHPDTGEQLTKAGIKEMPWLSPDVIINDEDDEEDDEDVGNMVPQRTGLKWTPSRKQLHALWRPLKIPEIPSSPSFESSCEKYWAEGSKMKAQGFLKLCISFSQSLPNTLELESAMMLDHQDGKLPYVCIFSDQLLFDLEVTREKGLCNKHLCRPEFQVEIDWSTASLGIWLSADLVRLSFLELGILSITVHRSLPINPQTPVLK